MKQVFFFPFFLMLLSVTVFALPPVPEDPGLPPYAVEDVNQTTVSTNTNETIPPHFASEDGGGSGAGGGAGGMGGIPVNTTNNLSENTDSAQDSFLDANNEERLDSGEDTQEIDSSGSFTEKFPDYSASVTESFASLPWWVWPAGILGVLLLVFLLGKLKKSL